MPDLRTIQELQQSVDNSAKRTEEACRVATYRAILAPAQEAHKESDWMLVIAGATLALILPHAKDLLEVYSLTDFQLAVGLLLASCFFALVARKSFAVVSEACETKNELAVMWCEAIDEHMTLFGTLREEARLKNAALENTLKLKGMFDPLEKILPQGWKNIAKEVQERETNPHRKWKEPVTQMIAQKIFIWLQTGFLFGAFIVLIITLHSTHPEVPATRNQVDIKR
jgi:hypothetical protein